MLKVPRVIVLPSRLAGTEPIRNVGKKRRARRHHFWLVREAGGASRHSVRDDCSSFRDRIVDGCDDRPGLDANAEAMEVHG